MIYLRKRLWRQAQTPSQTPSVFPPPKVLTDLNEFIALSDNSATPLRNHYLDGIWFEDVNYLYFMDFAEGGSQLALAQDKKLYTADFHRTFSFFFDFTRLRFDGRFIFGQDRQVVIRFGSYSDNNLGRVFRLTEPKDASQMLVSWQEFTGAYEWLDEANNVAYFYHDSRDFNLYVVIPIGGRFDEIEDRVTVSEELATHDCDFYQQLFEEALKEFSDLPVQKTVFKPVIPEPSPEELAREAAKKSEEEEYHARIEQRIAETSRILNTSLESRLKEFDLTFILSLKNEFRMIGTVETVKFTLHAPDNTTIYDFPVNLDSFEHLSAEVIAQDISIPACQFLDRHRDKFHAFKKLYQANSSFRELIQPSSRMPKLDYNLIFNQGRLFKPGND